MMLRKFASLTKLARTTSTVVLMARRAMSTEGLDYIKMPNLMNAKEGTVANWSKKVGEMFFEGDRLCEITFPIATIGIDANCNGILAKIIVDKYQTAPADSHIAVYALSKEYYMNFLADSMQDVSEAAKMADTAEVIEEKEKRPDAAALMKAIRHMIQSGKIDGASGFAKKLQSLARKGDTELMAAFEASYEGVSFNEDTFDEAFFLDNARDIIREDEDELLAAAQKQQQQSQQQQPK